MKPKLILICLTVFTLLSCRLSQLNPFNRVINYPQPEIAADNSYFRDLGCFESINCLPEEIRNGTSSIDGIYPVSDLYGGLNPSYPIAIAGSVRFADDQDVPASVFTDQCMGSFYHRYLVVVEDEIRLIDSADQMRELYAPIENEDEALSYAIALTGYSALYNLNSQLTLKHYQEPLEESYSRFDGENFSVRLFDTFLCGCGPHIIQSIDVTVAQNGEITLSEPQDAYRDRGNDGLCID